MKILLKISLLLMINCFIFSLSISGYGKDKGSKSKCKISKPSLPVIAAGGANTVVIKKDGTLWAWGYNEQGQVGDDTYTTKLTPTKISSKKDWAAIYASGANTFAIKKNCTLWAWGNNAHNALQANNRYGNYSSRRVPTQIYVVGSSYGLQNWSAIAPGGSDTIAIDIDGTLWAWGSGYSYEVSINISNDKDWVAISTDGSTKIALKKDGSLWELSGKTLTPIADGME